MLQTATLQGESVTGCFRHRHKGRLSPTRQFPSLKAVRIDCRIRAISHLGDIQSRTLESNIATAVGHALLVGLLTFGGAFQ